MFNQKYKKKKNKTWKIRVSSNGTIYSICFADRVDFIANRIINSYLRHNFVSFFFCRFTVNGQSEIDLNSIDIFFVPVVVSQTIKIDSCRWWQNNDLFSHSILIRALLKFLVRFGVESINFLWHSAAMSTAKLISLLLLCCHRRHLRLHAVNNGAHYIRERVTQKNVCFIFSLKIKIISSHFDRLSTFWSSLKFIISETRFYRKLFKNCWQLQIANRSKHKMFYRRQLWMFIFDVFSDTFSKSKIFFAFNSLHLSPRSDKCSSVYIRRLQKSDAIHAEK